MGIGKIDFFIQRLTEAIEIHETKKEFLWDEMRYDESKHQEIIINVYRIFMSVANVSQKQKSDELQKIAFIEEKLGDIPKAWRIAYADAIMHQEDEQAFIEQLKLDTIIEVEKILQEVRV